VLKSELQSLLPLAQWEAAREAAKVLHAHYTKTLAPIYTSSIDLYMRTQISVAAREAANVVHAHYTRTLGRPGTALP